MKEAIKYAQLHGPLFLGGTNLGEKLDINKRTGLVMIHDDEKKYLYIKWNNESTKMPESSFLHVVPITPIQFDLDMLPQEKPKAPKQVAHGKIQAQVSTPQSHVFAEGPGKTNNR